MKKLTKAQAAALQAAQTDPNQVVSFERANEAGMAILESLGLVVEGWAYCGMKERGTMAVNAEFALADAAQLVHEGKFEAAERSAFVAVMTLRDLQRRRYYLTDPGHMMANLTRQGKYELPEVAQ
jgi:hypothetical protein